MQHLISFFSSPHHSVSNPDPHHPLPSDSAAHLTHFTVSKFKQVISLLNRTGHARFRRAPQKSLPLDLVPESKPDLKPTTKPLSQTHPLLCQSQSQDFFSMSQPMSSATSSFLPTITDDGSVSNGKQGSDPVADLRQWSAIGKGSLQQGSRPSPWPARAWARAVTLANGQ